MDPTIDYDIAEINFRPKYKTRKSYARDSHGFELENNYFQDPSSSEESSSSDEGSFTLSLGKGAKQPQQPRLSKQHGMVAMLPSGTKSDRSSRHSPSPLRSYNHSPVKITSNPKKRLTFEIDSNEENRKNLRDESISESEEDGIIVAEEILPGSYSASGLEPSRHSSTTKKKVVKTFDLGEFSDSSSDTDEDTAAIKKSMFVRRIGKDTLMCLPKLSEYIKPQQKNVVAKKKQAETQHQQNGKRKGSTLNDVNVPANTKKRRKNVHMVKRQVAREESTVDDSTATEEEENVKVVRTERNPKLAKKRASAHRHARQSPGSPVSNSSQKSFAVLQNTTSKIIDSIYGNDEQDLEDMGAEIEQSVQQRTSRPSISFTSKGEEIRQTRSSKSKVKQNVEPCVPDPRRTDVALQRSRKRRLITEAESEEHHHIVSHDHKQQRRSQRLLVSDEEISDSAPVKVMEKQQEKKKKEADEEEVKRDDHKRQGRLLSFEAEKSNSSTVKNSKEKQQHKKKKKEEHDLKQQKVSEGEMSDGLTVKVMEKQQKQKKKEDALAKQKPSEVEGNKNKGQPLYKDKGKRKDASRDKKRRKLIDDSKSLYQHDQGRVHIPVANPDPETMDGTLRRSSRTRVPPINYLLGEQLVYEASASGGMVVKEIIRPSLSTTQQQIKPPKKRPKQSSTNVLQESKSLKSNSKVPPAKQKEPKHQKLDPKQHAEGRNLEVVEDNTKKTVALVPVSPRKKEPWGSTLLKSMFETESSLATELVEIVNEDGTKRPSVEVVKPLQSLRLCNASGSEVTPNDPFIMAILNRQKNTNFGVAILNKMGDKGEQSTENGSVCFFLISGEIILKIGDLELHPPVWSRIFVPEGISYTLKNLQHTPAVLVYVVTKSNKEHN